MRHNALSTLRKGADCAIRVQTRRISLTGAIERGLRKGQQSLDGRHDDHTGPARAQGRGGHSAGTSGYRSRDKDRVRNDYEHQNSAVGHGSQSLPYTTAASEFIYGTFAVNAAVKAGRRRLYKLYIHTHEDGRDSIGTEALRRRAEAAGVEVIRAQGSGWRQRLDRAAEGRPHNGYVLEASPIPVLPVTELHEMQATADPLRAQLVPLSQEEEAVRTAFRAVNGIATVAARGKQIRYPILLLLDRVTDLGNLGAILRSAYYFGVNAVILLDHGTAPLSAVTVKASAGAAELIPIFRIKDETGFIKKSKENGWHFVAAIAPEDTPLISNSVEIPQHDTLGDTLRQKPTVLMLGNEAEGLRPRIARMSNSTVSIEDAYGKHEGVDSLNVSVAAAILMRDLLRPFLGKKPRSR